MLSGFKMFSKTILVLLIFLNASAKATEETRSPGVLKRPEVFVISTLYKRHETMPAYGFAELRDLILKIDPDVFVLDVTPKEIREQKVWVGKVEYPEVIFPLIMRVKPRPMHQSLMSLCLLSYLRPQARLTKNLELNFQNQKRR
jgi:hypothetical protein